MQISPLLQSRLDTLPSDPGCYLMKDNQGEVIYVGKAINLRNRVRSYFHASALESLKARRLVHHTVDVQWIVVDSELEALILEMTLIKEHRPRYNIRLKDDKRYPYIKVHWTEAFPKVTVTRQVVNDGSRYFGPYTSAWAVHQTLDALRRIFSYLTCNRTITGEDKRACLYYDIKLCTAPCIGNIRQTEYRQMIDDLCQFLQGRTQTITSRLQAEMRRASEEMRFEHAAAIRDQLHAIENIIERQKVVSTEYLDSDVIAMARDEKEACVQVFFIRGGKLIGRDYFLMEGTEDTPDSEVMANFLKHFYDRTFSVPEQVLLPNEIEELNIIRQWLNTRQEEHKVKITVPCSGQQQELIQMAAKNASETLTMLKAQWQAEKHRQTEALSELQDIFGLSRPPNRIECYDISNIQGTSAVGSMVVFEQGVPQKNLYRRFNIRTVSGPDDFASIEEVLVRRFRRWKAAQDNPPAPGQKPDRTFGILPDLLIVDGGKGQLNRALEVLENYQLKENVAVAGLAKQQDELYLPDQKEAIRLPSDSQGLFLLQRIRDEAHRFAITSHRQKRRQKGLHSLLEDIPGIGPERRKALLKHFGSLENIRQASITELSSLPGISRSLAQVIKNNLG
ncbi:MAG: excinuclease ABC subunit UvrC [Chloroflexota bacterium]